LCCRLRVHRPPRGCGVCVSTCGVMTCNL
jgi:hypothetical protein